MEALRCVSYEVRISPTCKNIKLSPKRPSISIGSEMLRISYCLDNGLTDGGKAVSLTLRSLFHSPVPIATGRIS
jgi:hypothetical protein